jgi:hypothetical protein
MFLPVHNDIDFLYSTTTVIKSGKPAMNDESINYFCFPEKGVFLALGNYDVLLFNPHK